MKHINSLMAGSSCKLATNEFKINPEMYFKLLIILKINYNNFTV